MFPDSMFPSGMFTPSLFPRGGMALLLPHELSVVLLSPDNDPFGIDPELTELTP